MLDWTKDFHRVQALILDTATFTGVFPFKYDYGNIRLIKPDSSWFKIRWVLTLLLSFGVKLVLLLTLIKDYRRGKLRLGVFKDLMRIVTVTAFTYMGILDFLFILKRNAFFTTINKMLDFHKKFQGKPSS
jgi:hypothetical protein